MSAKDLPVSSADRALAPPGRRGNVIARHRRRLPRAHCGARWTHACVHRGLSRSRARWRGRSRSRAQGRPGPRSAAWPADRAEGSAARQGPSDDGGVEELARTGGDRNCHRGREAPRRRDDSARQDAHGRIRFRRVGAQRADGRAVESVGHARSPRRRGLEQRVRSRGRRGPGARRDRPTPADRYASPQHSAG
jgi:hypothetical protein